MNSTIASPQFLIDRGWTFFELLSVSTANEAQEEAEQLFAEFSKTQTLRVDFTDVIVFSEGRGARDLNSNLVHDAMQNIIQPFNCCMGPGS